jgi:hypothetical protein
MLTMTRPAHDALFAGLTLGVSLAAAGCSNSQSPAVGGPQFSTQVGINDFQQRIDSGPARVRIVLADTGLVAIRVNIHRPDQIDRPERIEGPITDISGGGAGGNITLAVAGLVIGFDSTTRFGAADEGEDRQGDEQDSVQDSVRDSLRWGGSDTQDTWGEHFGEHGPLTAAEFVTHVQAALAAGEHPAVVALRQPPATPQAPDDATFLARQIQLDHEADHPRIELNVAAANFQANGSPPPDGWLQVLGLKIALDVTDGITHLEVSTPETEGEHHFRGVVQSVDQGAGTVLLTDSTVVRIVAGTRIESADREGWAPADSTELATLADVQAALTAGKSVVCKGEGILDTATPPVWDAVEVEFRVAPPGP